MTWKAFLLGPKAFKTALARNGNLSKFFSFQFFMPGTERINKTSQIGIIKLSICKYK